MRLVKQHRGNASQLRIVQHGRNENRLGHHQHAGSGAALAVEPGQVANRFAGCFADQLGHPFGRGACSNPARREQDHAAVAPRLGQQGGGDRGGLTGPRRRDQHSAAARVQGYQKVRQNGMDRERGHPCPLGPAPPSGKALALAFRWAAQSPLARPAWPQLPAPHPHTARPLRVRFRGRAAPRSRPRAS